VVFVTDFLQKTLSAGVGFFHVEFMSKRYCRGLFPLCSKSVLRQTEKNGGIFFDRPTLMEEVKVPSD
jgi:hypothetical protein